MLEKQYLQDAKGYRSKYINALNDAVHANRIVGGDVQPITTAGGTILLNKNRFAQKRFQLFWGLVGNTVGETTTMERTQCVGDGCVFIGGELIMLANASNTGYKARGLLPRSSGWYTKAVGASSWELCEVFIVASGGAYYMAFRYDGADWSSIIDGATETEVVIISHLGNFHYSSGEIEQFVSSDVYYGGMVEETAPEPWEVFSTMELNEDTQEQEQVWWIVHPQWFLDAPFHIYPDEAIKPMPEKAIAWEEHYTNLEYREMRGEKCWKLDEVITTTSSSPSRGYLYAILDTEGNPKVYSFSNRLADTPSCICIGYFTEETITTEIDGEEVTETIVKWTQEGKGIFRSFWRETPAFYIKETPEGAIIRYSNPPVNLKEGTTMLQYSFWMLETHINGELYKISEQLNNAEEKPLYPYPQYALLYGNWIWRYNLHYRLDDNTLIKDEITTPVVNVTASLFARILEQPYVDRIEVVYPETPLDQGQVNEVHAKIKVLAVEIGETGRTTLFKTEVINATEGGIIEVTQ